MSSYYIDLPAAQYPRNALLDFSPIRQAMMDRRNQEQQMYERQRQEMLDQRSLANQEYERKRQENSDLMQQQRFGWEKQKHDVGEYGEINGNLILKKPDGSVKVVGRFDNSIFGENNFPSDNMGPQPQTSAEINNNEQMLGKSAFKNPSFVNNLPDARSNANIVNEGPQAFYGNPINAPSRVEMPAQQPTEKPKPEAVKTPRGYITKEMATEALRSPNVGDRELAKYVLKELEDKKPKALTENQTKMADYADRMIQSERVIDSLAGFDPTNFDQSFLSKLGLVGNYTNTKEWKQYEQAARQSLAAILRRDTGAAVTQQEFDLYFPMFYPQPNDPLEVIMQKTNQRKRIAEGLRLGSGGAYEQMFPQTLNNNAQKIETLPNSGVVQNGIYAWPPQREIR